MAASLAGLYGGGYGQSQEDGSGGRSGFFGRGQKNKFGGVPATQGGTLSSGLQDQPASQQQHQQHQYGDSELALIKE